jgi:predicted dehydrogenase
MLASPNRRQFLRAGLTAAAGLSASSWSRVQGANSDLRVAVVGFRGQGGSHISNFLQLKDQGVRLVALCDVDREVLGKRAAKLAQDGNPVESFTDVRKLLEWGQVDAISTATPNHWHALVSIWAMQAGKDVYVEKPVSHNVWEGRQMVKAARALGRIVQTGTQSRSSRSGIAAAIAWLREGHLGKITVARGFCYKPRKSIGKVTSPQTPPASVDYDLWTGPAPLEPLTRKQLHYDWHWVWPTGNGDLGNQGIHQMDLARWALGADALSPLVLSLGGRLGYDDDGTTPNSQVIYHGYPEAPLIFEVRGLPKDKASQEGDLWNKSMDDYKGARVGVVVECEGGYLTIPNYTSAQAFDREGKMIRGWSGTEDHHKNFIAAVRSRKPGDLHADILEGHLSSALCHTGNISHQLGRPVAPGDLAAALRDQPLAAEAAERLREHLARNAVDLAATPLILGQALQMDPATERFTNHPEANARLTREYRAPYVVPAIA